MPSVCKATHPLTWIVYPRSGGSQILTLIDLAPLVTVIGFFQAPERWRHCFTTKLKIARAATSAAIGFIMSGRSKHWLNTKNRAHVAISSERFADNTHRAKWSQFPTDNLLAGYLLSEDLSLDLPFEPSLERNEVV